MSMWKWPSLLQIEGVPLTIQCSSAHSLEAARAALHQYFSNQPGPQPKVGALRLIELKIFILMFDCRVGDSETGGDSGSGKQPHLCESPQELGKLNAYMPQCQGSYWQIFAQLFWVNSEFIWACQRNICVPSRLVARYLCIILKIEAHVVTGALWK